MPPETGLGATNAANLGRRGSACSTGLLEGIVGKNGMHNGRITHSQWMQRIQEEDDFYERRERVARGVRRCQAVMILHLSSAFRRISAFKRQSFSTEISAKLLESQARTTVLLEKKLTTMSSRRRFAYLLLCACDRMLADHFATWHTNVGLVTVICAKGRTNDDDNNDDTGDGKRCNNNDDNNKQGFSTDEEGRKGACESTDTSKGRIKVGAGFDINAWRDSIVIITDTSEKNEHDDEPLDNFLEREAR